MKSHIRSIILSLGFLSTTAFCGIDHLNLELKRMPFQRDSMILDRTDWDYEVSLKFKANAGLLLFESDVTGQSSRSRFRMVWWDYILGITVTDYIDLVWDHRSQHLLDLDKDKYDVRDSYGIRIKFFEK